MMTSSDRSKERQPPREVCPHTGMPITELPEWHEIRFNPGYRLTVRVIGRSILDCRPSGFATQIDANGAINLYDRVVEEAIGSQRSYVHLTDYSELQGASLEARRIFLDYLRRRQRQLAAVVICGAPPLIKLSSRIASRLSWRHTELLLADTYAEGMALAVKCLVAHDLAGRAGQDVPSGPNWQRDLGDCTVRFQVTGDRIVCGTVAGYLREQHVAPLLALTNKVIGDTGDGSPATVVVDLSLLRGLTLAARRRFVAAAVGGKRQPAAVAQVLCHGCNHLLRGAIAISNPFLPFPVGTAPDLKSALEIARNRPPAGSAWWHRPLPWLPWLDRWRRHGATMVGQGQAPAPSPEVEDLLRFLATVDWESDSPPALDTIGIGHEHPLAPVLDAVMLIKAEVDRLLRQQRDTEQALRQSEHRYRDILRSIVDGFYELDQSGTITYANASLLRMLGRERQELLGHSYRLITDIHHARTMRTVFDRVFATGEPAEAVECELLRKDGTTIAAEISISLKLATGQQPIGFRGVVRDVSERVQAAQERERLEVQLRHAQRMEAIGTLAGGIAHNFNNLLMGIQGNISILAQSEPLEPDQRRRLATMEELIRGGSRLTSQLLDYARKGPTEVGALELNELVQRTADTVALTRKEIRIHRSLDPELRPVLADREQIEQVLLNLLINAVEAMPAGGDLTITTSMVPETGLVCMAVQDTGIGMDPETRERIFEPFFTTKGLDGGTGLGLASCYGIVEAHRGVIQVDSEPGVGSVFSVLLPATQEEIKREQVESRAGSSVTGEGQILVVDDDEAVLEATGTLLQSLGYTARTASCGAEALKIYGEAGGELKLVVLDMILPDMSGGAVFDRLRSINPEVKVLLSSGYSISGTARSILERGCNDFIQKPYSVEQLSLKIAAVLGRTMTTVENGS